MTIDVEAGSFQKELDRRKRQRQNQTVFSYLTKRIIQFTALSGCHTRSDFSDSMANEDSSTLANCFFFSPRCSHKYCHLLFSTAADPAREKRPRSVHYTETRNSKHFLQTLVNL